MKILKIILFSFVVLIFLAVIGLFVFLKTFDVQKFKPQIVKSASDALGRQVDFSGIALKVSLRDGIAPSIGLSADLKYIGNKLLQQKAKEQIGRFLDKVFKQEKE